MSEESKTTPQNGTNWPLLVLILSIVVTAAFLAYYLRGKGAENNPAGPNSVNQTILEEGKDYLIYPLRIEVASNKKDGKPWDVDKSGPDIFYEISWQGNVVYKSETQKDTLIGQWVPIGVNLVDALMSGSLSIDQVVKLKIIKFDKAKLSTTSLIVTVYDNDLVENDKIEALSFDLTTLKIGDNIISYKDQGSSEVLSVTLRVIDNTLGIPEKVKLMSSGN